MRLTKNKLITQRDRDEIERFQKLPDRRFHQTSTNCARRE